MDSRILYIKIQYFIIYVKKIILRKVFKILLVLYFRIISYNRIYLVIISIIKLLEQNCRFILPFKCTVTMVKFNH